MTSDSPSAMKSPVRFMARGLAERVVVGKIRAALPSPLVGEGGSIAQSAIETDEGSVSADRDPSSGALCAPPSPTRGLLRNPRFVILLGKALESNDGGKADRTAEFY